MKPIMEKIKVQVPATSANLGSGFDCAGLAYDLYNVFEFEPIDEGLIIDGCDEKYANKDNPAYAAYSAVCKKIGAPVSVKITILETNVPVSRGLGSSATLICAGAYAANRLYGQPLSWDEVFEICTEIEGHPDNVAPALFGSFCTSLITNGKPRTVRFEVSPKIHFTVLIPNFEVKTRDARSVLPHEIERDDAIYNMSRIALLPYAFEKGDFDLLKVVTRDRLHQKYRKKLFKNIDDIKKQAYECGAISFMISGAGSTCLCLSERSIEKELNEKISALPNGWVAKELRISVNGTREVL
ncbi:MAG: homoserine kinase [Clostridia bacterium]|nr:homoserine kinase [Clostridia bacterium]